MLLPSTPPEPHLSLGNHSWKGPPGSEASSLPRPHTLASPPVYSLGLQGCHLARESLSSFLLPAGTCPVWEQHVPGSNPDAGEAPAWSPWWQVQRQTVMGLQPSRQGLSCWPWWHQGWGHLWKLSQTYASLDGSAGTAQLPEFTRPLFTPTLPLGLSLSHTHTVPVPRSWSPSGQSCSRKRIWSPPWSPLLSTPH